MGAIVASNHTIRGSVEGPQYWLKNWLRSNKIGTVEDASRVLSDAAKINEMRDVSEQWAEATREITPVGVNLVAGTGLRFDDSLMCPNPPCRRRYVDVLFRHAWHYFDRVLLTDAVGALLSNPPRNWDESYRFKVLLDRISLVLYIEGIGANDLVHYYPRHTTSTHALTIEELTGFNGEQWFSAWREVKHTLALPEHYRIEPAEGDYRFKVTFEGPYLEGIRSSIVQMNGPWSEEEDIRSAFVQGHLQEHMMYLAQDLRSKRTFNSSLGATVPAHENVLSRLSRRATADDILFRLSMPSLADVPIQELIEIRSGEQASFIACRGALIKAAGEMLKASDSEDPRVLAGQLLKDVIEPEMARLSVRLKSAQRSLARKTGVSVVLSGLTAVCGALLGLSIPAATLAGATCLTASAATGGGKYLDEKQAIEFSDFYFFWKALGHAE